MASTTLPAIVQPNRPPSGGASKSFVLAPPTSKKVGSGRTLNKRHVGAAKVEDADLKHRPGLLDTSSHRNTHKQNLCLEMLSSGHVNSFCEFFSLTHPELTKPKTNIEEKGEDDEAEKPLDTDPKKLDRLREGLTQAETARRHGEIGETFKSYEELGEYFEQEGSFETSIHFYTKALQVSKDIEDDRKTEAEANCKMGLALERQGKLAEAAQYFETFYELCVQSSPDGKISESASHHLVRAFTAMASQSEDKGDIREALSYHKKCLDLAKEVGDQAFVASANYRIGRAYETLGEMSTAFSHLHESLVVAEQLQDKVAEGGRVLHSLSYSKAKATDPRPYSTSSGW
eukprot:Colp12_sorted_trinity150504_noHs@4080